MSRKLRIASRILLALVFLLILVVVGLQIALATPVLQRVLRTRLEATLSQRLRRQVEIGQVTLSPFLNFLELRRVGVKVPGGSSLLEVRSIRFYPDPRRLLRGALAVRAVVLLGPVVNLTEGLKVREGAPAGQFLAPLVRLFEGQGLLALQVDRLQIRDGRLIYRREERTWTIRGLDADVWREEARLYGEVQAAGATVHFPHRSLTWGKIVGLVVFTEQDITLTRLGVDLGEGSLEVTGRVRSLAERQGLDITFTAERRLSRRGLLPHVIQVEGALTGSSQSPHFQGSARLGGGMWPDLGVDLTADREHLRGERLRLLNDGGEIKGRIVFQWKELRYSVEVRGEGLNLDHLARARREPLPVTGTVAIQASGEGQALTGAGLTAQATFQVTALTRRGRTGPGARVEGIITADKGQVSLERLEVDLPPNRLSMKGSLGDEVSLEVSARLPQVERIGEFLGAEELGGKGTVVGQVGGPLAAPAFRGTVTWDNPRLLGRDFRQIRGEIHVEKRTLTAPRLLVTRGQSTGTIRLRLTVPEKGGVFDPKQDLEIEADGNVQGPPQDFLALFVKRAIPLTGRMMLDARVGGVPERLEGRGHLLLKDATVLGEPWQEAESDLELEPNRLRFTEVRLARGTEQVRGNGLLNLTDLETSFHLATAGLSIEGFRLFAGSGLNGQMQGEIRGEGRIDNPTIRADATLNHLQYTTIPLGSGRGSCVLEDRALTIAVALPERGYAARGSVQAVDPFAYVVDVTLERADLAPLFALTRSPLLMGGTGTGSGAAHMEGTFKARGPSRGTLELSAPALRLHGLTLHTPEPIRLILTEDALTISSIALKDRDGWLNVRGQVAFRGAADLDVEGKIPLAILGGQVAIAEGRGAADVKLKVSGLWASPEYRGGVTVEGGSLRWKEHAEAIAGITGHADFRATRIHIPRVVGTWAGGTVKVSGSASRTKKKAWAWNLDLLLDTADARRVFPRAEGGEERLSGRASLWGKLTATGRQWDELQHSLKGKAKVRLEDGTFRRFTVIANIFRVLNLAPDPAEGIPYKLLEADFDLKKGVAETQDLKFISSTAKMSGVGKIDLGRREVDMLFGLQPLTAVDKVINFLHLDKIPLLGRLLFGKEGSVLVVPVKVKGPLAAPEVAAVPLRSLEKGVLGTFRRVLELPTELIPTEKSEGPQ